jgi:copper chaperone
MPAAATPPREYSVHGMTCEHCVMSVREELAELAGIAGVDVDLAAARLTVTGTDLDDGAIIAAVAEAGYQAMAA